MAKLVGKTYGDALFDTGIERGILDSLTEEVEVVREVVKTDTDFKKFLNHPKIDKDEKIKIIQNVFKNRVSDELLGLLTIIISKDRQNNFDEIFDYFINRVKEYKKIGIVYVTSPLKLTQVQTEQIKSKILSTTKYEELEVHYNIDESLIGGLVIRIGDRIVDSSVKTKIYNLSRDLSKIQLS